MRQAHLIILGAVVAACACNGPVQDNDHSGEPTASPTSIGPVSFSCGGRPFTPELLAEPPNAELASNSAAAALRAFLLTTDAEGFLPDSGWLLVGLDDAGASFIAQVPGDPPFVEVEVERQPGSWKVVGYGQCRPSAALIDLNGATWTLDPDLPVPGPTTVEFVALVTETECASGQSSEGRIVGPAVTYGSEEVVVVFAVRFPLGEIQSCQSNPATRVVVTLEEPLGARRLLDGGVFPAHDPTEQGPLP